MEKVEIHAVPEIRGNDFLTLFGDIDTGGGGDLNAFLGQIQIGLVAQGIDVFYSFLIAAQPESLDVRSVFVDVNKEPLGVACESVTGIEDPDVLCLVLIMPNSSRMTVFMDMSFFAPFSRKLRVFFPRDVLNISFM